MSNPDAYKSTPNKVDFANSADYPSDPDTVNYNYILGTYNPPRPFESNYQKTNYDITNFPKTNYNQFNASLTNYQPVPEKEYTIIESDVNQLSICQSPDMLYQLPRDPQYNDPEKYMCFNNDSKLLEITKHDKNWSAKNLTNSKVHIKWQGSQCKITTPNICNRDALKEGCEATCFISPNDAVQIKYKNNIWRVPSLESQAGPCTMTAISEDTAQKSYCNCDNVLERPNLMTKPTYDKDLGGKFWCSS
jgi:hypothetical protein